MLRAGFLIITLSVSCHALVGCGQKGPLYLPETPPPPATGGSGNGPCKTANCTKNTELENAPEPN